MVFTQEKVQFQQIQVPTDVSFYLSKTSLRPVSAQSESFKINFTGKKPTVLDRITLENKFRKTYISKLQPLLKWFNLKNSASFKKNALWSGFEGIQHDNYNFGLCWKEKVGQVVTHMALCCNCSLQINLTSLLQTSPNIPPKLPAALGFLKCLKTCLPLHTAGK